ncbi:hypothetical protein B6S12_07460 [Helicobacter valdiviensis]|uniref:DnaA initiator-associating factor for replication initiation HobA n=1 Tax=Helicobacter valdiviensis TaxID=1458358 RepID=A0A2W6NK45_9HELI|nr:HobA family DNA replication regulator [Helicobacter valdiviensis]PZT47756.1 hypothetical protein B6S12_07460 [Helicobacter valdiviensis]
MLNLTDWSTKNIRQDESHPTWLEERKYEWIPLLKGVMFRLFAGEALILVTDRERDWFANYVAYSVNKTSSRPYLPILSINALFPQIDKAKEEELEIALINDYLDNLFAKRCFFWYVGKNNSARAKLALSREGGFLWIFDEEMQNSFTLQSSDNLVDIKLMQLYRIFNQTLEAVLLGKVSLD